jgi:ABC-2 type transport system ATP-binding protein
MPEGSMYGFIGPNGSGKSTTVRTIANICMLAEPSARARGVYRKMRVRWLLEFHAVLRGSGNPASEVGAWLERLGLANWADQKVAPLSKGMSQKVQFIAIVTPEPKLLILDEPFSGLDPVSADSIRGAMLEMKRRVDAPSFSAPTIWELLTEESPRRHSWRHSDKLRQRHHSCRTGRRARGAWRFTCGRQWQTCGPGRR